jgi:uncharacterized membrane protein
MSNRANTEADPYSRTTRVLWSLLVLYSAARVLQAFPDRIPILAVVALHVLLPLLFALIHGARFYRFRGILIFAVLFLVIGNLIENLGVATGFPFGGYYFTDVMGPKLFHVPIFLGLAYLGTGYLSWTLAGLILGGLHRPLAGSRLITVPLIASFLMVAWDLSSDPVWSTVLHCWIWQHGGAYFGVPLTNFFGWYFTSYLFFQLFAFYLRARPANAHPLPRSYWQQAILFYVVSAVGNLFVLLGKPPGGLEVVSDPTGTQWRVRDVATACALISLVVMLPFARMAWLCLAHGRVEALTPDAPTTSV